MEVPQTLHTMFKMETIAPVVKLWQFLWPKEGLHRFLEQCAYESMLNSVVMVNIQEADLTTTKQKLLNDVRDDCKNYTDVISEHDYT